jgi:hypothetical protein
MHSALVEGEADDWWSRLVGGHVGLNQSQGGISMGCAPDHVGFTLALV